MKGFHLVLAGALALSACSETPIDDQTAEETAAIEKEIEEEAQSLEEAADEAVKVLEAEVTSDLPPEPTAPSPDQTGD